MRRYETFDTTDFSGHESRRLRPPTHLGPREKAVFIDLITGCDPRHFRPADLPLMQRYVEAVCLAEEAAQKLAVEGAVIDGKPSAWFGIHQASCKTVAILALRLRIGPQSRQPRAHKTTPGPVSAYEILDLEADHGGAKSS